VSKLAAFGRFWWDFIVGDDWVSAAGIVIGLAITAALEAWWVLPIVVAVVLTLSLVRAVRA
jgi:hypothetical protein